MGNIFSQTNESTSPSPSSNDDKNTTPSDKDEVSRNSEDDYKCAGENVGKIAGNATTFTIIFWIIVIYLLYVLFKSIYKNKGTENETNGQGSYSRTIDLVLLFLLVGSIFASYYNLEEKDQENIFGYTLQTIQDFFGSAWGLFELIWFTIIFFALIYILKVPMTPGVKPVIVEFVESKIWIIYVIFGVVLFFQHILDIPLLKLLFDNSVMNYFKNVKPYDEKSSSPGCDSWFDNDDDDDDDDEELVTSPDVAKDDKQVFNVSNNLYTYEEAQQVCSAFDASLATYDQIENAYNNGAEWCNYGWSDGQMAFFPTQKETWKKLQDNFNTRQVCGRPGVNGGFMKNPYIRFGANCYGMKPDQPNNWQSTSYVTECTNAEDPNKKLRDGARLNSFNAKKWSRY